MAVATPPRRALARVTLWPSWVATVATAVVVLAGVTVSTRLQYLPLAVSVVAFGLPHGAVDHLTVWRAAGRPSRRRAFAAVGLVYLLGGALVAATWALAPVAAFWLFILLTWFHWGQGDLYPLVAVAGADYLRTRTHRGLTVAVRGALPMVVPLLAFPGEYRAVADGLVAVVRPGTANAFGGPLARLLAPGPRAALAAGFVALAVGTLALGYRRATPPRTAWRLDVAETALLGAYFATVPPVLAVGLYFCVWHSLRHVGRLVALEEGTGGVGRKLVRFGREAAPLTAGAVVLLGAIALAVPNTPETVVDGVAVYLVVVSMLTLPHVAVVTWLDARQGLW